MTSRGKSVAMGFFFPKHPMEFLGYGVVAIASERIAAQDAPGSKNKAFDGSMLLDGLHRIGRACGGEAACWRSDRRNDLLVEINRNQKNPR